MDTLGVMSHAIPATTLLRRVASELSALHAIAKALPMPDGLSCPEALAAAQRQDLLEQSLAELSRFLVQGADGFPSAATGEIGEALAQVRLSALADRLAGIETVTSEPHGEVDLF